MTERNWRVDFESINSGSSSKPQLDPPGFSNTVGRELVASSSAGVNRPKDPTLIQKKQEALMSRATGTFKQVGFMMFMMYMMGNSIQIFSIIMILSGLVSPITAILQSRTAFPPDPEGQLDTLTPRILYCLIQFGQLLFVLYKLNSMGLLPTYPSDWLAATSVPVALEHSAAPIM